LASYLLIATYFASDSYAVYRWGVYLPTALLGYAMTIVIAGILIDTKFGFFLTALTTLFITPLWYLQANGMLTFQPQNINGSDGVVFGALYAVIMIITWLSNRETGRSLARARKSEQELQHERDSLEIKVENRTRELRKAQFEKMEQVNQFAKLGQLASGLFHDMLNIMNTLSLTIDLRDEDKNPMPTESRSSAGNTSTTTKQIEQFMVAIRKQLHRQECDERFSIAESIDQVIQLLSCKAHREGVRIAFEHEGIPDIVYFGNPFKFHQIMFNLILNAIESHETTGREPGRERAVRVSVEERESAVAMRVSDRGCGIDKTVREKILDPFFSTKKEPKGMGIGLASVKKIVEEDFGGTITVTDNDGVGSVFAVTFPTRQE
jgi:signal transduction histidine kinase